jgi:hypothetical protein
VEDVLSAVVFFGGGGLVFGFVLALVVRSAAVAAALVFAAAVAFVLWAYFSAPTDEPPEGCSDCGEWLGRWWEPGLVGIVLIFNLLVCGVAAFLGRALRARL